MISLPNRKTLPALLVLGLLILTVVSCKNFFPDPNLTSIAITPAGPSVAIGSTVSLTATGTYDDNSTKNLNATAKWTSSDSSLATISPTGVVTGVNNGSPLIQATVGSVIGSVNVAVGNATVLQSISVSPATATVAASQTQQFLATGHYSDGTTPDITSMVTWTSDTPGVAAMSSTTPGLATVSASATTGQTAGITATLNSISNTTKAILTVQ
jgi:trimeric autotransporter adhesin